MSYLIDEAFSGSEGRQLAKREAFIVLIIFTALQSFLSIPNASFWHISYWEISGLVSQCTKERF